jgi:hypothetical protein
MEKKENRVDALAVRCTRSAWLFLSKFHEHPRFPEFLDRLTATTGPLLESDVEQLFREVLIQRPKKKEPGITAPNAASDRVAGSS